jgi:hypothetical protein
MQRRMQIRDAKQTGDGINPVNPLQLSTNSIRKSRVIVGQYEFHLDASLMCRNPQHPIAFA